MPHITMGDLNDITKDYVPREFLVDKLDHYYFRNRQSDEYKYRSLASQEIEILVKNNNTAEDWDKILVSENFDPSLVRNCEFWGMVRIGDLSANYLEHHKLRLPVGLHNCTIISCDIGDHVALRNVRYLSHYIIGDQCLLFNIDEMHTVDNAKFGNGIVKAGESEDVRIWLEVGNENGGRRILPFEGILPADAYLWSRFREDGRLLERFREMTDQLADTRRGYYGTVENQCVIKNCRIIKDVKVGSHAYIKGANKLKNLTILSSAEEHTQIGEGVELVNGIVGYGNRIFYGVKAVRFVSGRNVQLKYGARLLNSVIGPNSTVSCCEILNNLIFPFHEQHHNNSFLIASTVQGQSNIAAGATIGSNHNSRAADGEILAERGFWPGLETSFKHNSVFSAFTLISKGSYKSELNITLPFSLVSPGTDDQSIYLMPGYWFRYNMYALARNSWKFRNRDKRKHKDQHIEMDYLAPDTAEQMIRGMTILKDAISSTAGTEFSDRQLLENQELDRELDVVLDGIMNKGRAHILKPVQGFRLYRMMLLYYAAKELVTALAEPAVASTAEDPLESLRSSYKEPAHTWYNVGGQLISEPDVLHLNERIKSGDIKGWNEVHKAYDDYWRQYPLQRRNHAIYCLLHLEHCSTDDLNAELIEKIALQSVETARMLVSWTWESRKKDYTGPFRKAVYRNEAEMESVLGSIHDNSFIAEMKKETELYTDQVKNMLESIKITGK